MLTIAYVTGRREPRLGWFARTLVSQVDHLHPRDRGILKRVIIISPHAIDDTLRSSLSSQLGQYGVDLIVSKPKPTVWQGPHRLTSKDYFAVSNARNTAICLTQTGHIAFVDDLSALDQDWLLVATGWTRTDTVVCGRYTKANNIIIDIRDSGAHMEYDVASRDARNEIAKGRVIPCQGNWMYGCTLVAPIQAFLDVNGYPEACDSMGYEDVVCGPVIQNAGYKFFYDPYLHIIESEADHHVGVQMAREDPCRGDPNANPRDDMSHAALRMWKNEKRFMNFFGPEGISGLRNRVLRGEEFPVMTEPSVRWFDSKLLSEL